MHDKERAACVKLCTRALAAWGFTRDEARTIAERDDEGLKELSLIVVGVDGMYDDDAVVTKWMRMPRKELGGNTPMLELLGGGLRRVHDLVRYEANR